MTIRSMELTHRLAARAWWHGIAIATLLIASGAFLPHAVVDAHSQVAEALGDLKSPDWNTRAKAFYTLISSGLGDELHGRTWLVPSALAALLKQDPARSDHIKVGLIELLVKENRTARRPTGDWSGPPRLTEEYTNYWGDVVAAVAALKDQRALDALMANLWSGNMATNAVAGLGRAALDRVTPLTNDPDVVMRNGAVRTLSQMLDPANAQALGGGDGVAKIEAALRQATRDKEPEVRISAIEGLGKLTNPDIIPILTSLAQRDPYQRPGDAVGSLSYPVREAAAKALANRSALPK